MKIGLIGCGFIAELHMQAYRRVYGVNVEVVAVSARGDQVVDFAKRHRIAATHRDYRALIADKTIDVIDICTPPALHGAMIVESMRRESMSSARSPSPDISAAPGDPEPIGKRVAKSAMYQRVLEEMDATADVVRRSGRLFMYAEDWIYAPAVTKTAEIVRASKDKILFMKAEESHSGSHAAHAAHWSHDRRRLADPHGLPSPLRRAPSEAGRGRGAGRDHHGHRRHRRYRQSRRRGSSPKSGPSSRRAPSMSRIGAC